MIIGFCGRMRSGKTTLADICERDFGFTKLSFATPLKQLCSNLMGVTLDELNKLKNDNTEINLTFTEDMIHMLSEEVGIPVLATRSLVNGKTMANVRDLLQFVGTDIIRLFDNDWHVNKIHEMIQEGKNYVIDDVRFPNEKEMVESLGGICWFLTRPHLRDVSNHVSEESIVWRDCWPNIIINDTDLETLKARWSAFMEEYEKSVQFRNSLYHSIILDEPNKFNEMSEVCQAYFIHKNMLSQREVKLHSDIISFGASSTGVFTVTTKDGNKFETKNALEIEDLKKYIHKYLATS